MTYQLQIEQISREAGFWRKRARMADRRLARLEKRSEFRAGNSEPKSFDYAIKAEDDEDLEALALGTYRYR